MKKLLKFFGISLGIFILFIISGMVIYEIATTPEEKAADEARWAEKQRQEEIAQQKYEAELIEQQDIAKQEQKEQYSEFLVLKEWKSGELNPNGRVLSSSGFYILIDENLEQEEIIEIVKQLAKKDSSVVVKVFSTQKAYEEDISLKFTNEYKKGYILYFSKNEKIGSNGRITWMQEIGKLEKLYGSKTEL